MPDLPFYPLEFLAGKRYTQERYESHQANPDGFLWPEEEKLVHYVIRVQEEALAWEEIEKGRFKEEYFDPVLIPTIDHVPWVLKNIPIPPGIYNEVVQIIWEKIAAGVYEDSNASYRSRWFCVLKKDGKALRLVHDLQPLNKITVKDSAVPPITEPYAESFAGWACYGTLDLFVSFDQRTLDEQSRDLTTFQTPLGTKRLTSVPMGYTNAMQIMHGDVTFILQEEIPHITIPFVDDVPVKGPLTRYERPDGSFETIPENPGIRRFVWEHMNNFNRILQRMKKVGGTFNGKKLVVCAPSAVVVGHRCSYEGRIPDESYVQRIKDWPACRTVTEVRSFLGTCGVLRIFIKDYSKRTRKLVHLTRKDVPFQFGEKEQTAMEDLKDAVVTSPALKPIDYQCGREVILAVDSSVIAVGFILLQLGGDGKRYPSRFGSIAWNDRESRYSQAKVELYGLFRALRSYRIWLVGLETFTVEVDAKYIKGMLSNPDIQPNAVMNRWIARILMFDFDLVHVPAEKHVAADGLSRRPEAASDGKEEDDFEDWIDQAQGFAMELLNPGTLRDTSDTNTVSGRNRVLDGIPEYILANEEEQLPIPRTDKAKKRDRELLDIQEFLQNPKRKAGMKDPEFQRFI